MYACALIKKRRYWQSIFPDGVFDAHFSHLAVGVTDAISGFFDGKKYFFWGVTEPDYITKMMATGGELFSGNGCPEVSRTWKSEDETVWDVFCYTNPYHWNFKYLHVVDDHNNLHHAMPSLEDTWRTEHWPVKVFTFLLAVTEINIYLALKYFVWEKSDVPKLLDFQHTLGWELIYNPMLVDEEKRRNEC